VATKTLASVITDVLQAKGSPMSAAEVYAAINGNNLFEFNSKDPLGIVRNAMSRHSIENQHSCASNQKCFSQLPDGRYLLAARDV